MPSAPPLRHKALQERTHQSSQKNSGAQTTVTFEFGSFSLAGHLLVAGFWRGLSEAADERAPIHAVPRWPQPHPWFPKAPGLWWVGFREGKALPDLALTETLPPGESLERFTAEF